MHQRWRPRRWHVSLACAIGVAVAGCAGMDGDLSGPTQGPFLPERVPLSSARQLVRPGQGKAEVVAALGPAAAVRFDSGYEVWVYRQQGSGAGPAEFVILFAPSGVVQKTRVRPADGIPPG